MKGNGLIVRRFFAPCERCGENVADPNGANPWTTHLHARLKAFVRSTFLTLKSRTNTANGCIDGTARKCETYDHLRATVPRAVSLQIDATPSTNLGANASKVAGGRHVEQGLARWHFG